MNPQKVAALLYGLGASLIICAAFLLGKRWGLLVSGIVLWRLALKAERL